MNWFNWLWQGLNTPLVNETMNNFTPRAQQVLALARKEADRINHNFLGTEHLLLGLISLGQGTAVNVLAKMGLDLATVRAEVEKQVGTGPDQKTIGNIPYTPRVKQVLAMAAKEAGNLNHTYVGTEHILLGLLREGDGVAARVLKHLGVDVETTRQHILEALDPNFSPALETTVPVKESKSQEPRSAAVDINKRYDVYCREGNEEVVYRNARFRSVRTLLKKEEYDFLADYVELEQASGETLFVARFLITRFCEHRAATGSGIPARGSS
jgi:ATP-dependent Clp protease ATP-binding subunit ClpA